MFVIFKGDRGSQGQGWPVRIDTPVQERVRDLLVEFPRKGCPGDNGMQEALREVAE
ncbi:MAG TPA: hypothetical protein VEU97_01470 [Ktedonobacteraceae bacterium]|nr:hypothetical protein [Ktedonobacteraceae bacterium]